VKLDVLDEDEALLEETFEQFRQAAQYVADYGWRDNPADIVKSKSKLNDATYDDVREATDLTANHVQAARSLAA
jgi:predicted transposase